MWSCFEKETHLPSGENCGVPIGPTSLEVSSSVSPLPSTTRLSLWSEPAQSRLLESGAQTAADLSQSASVIFFGLWPRSSATQISSRPERSETNAIDLPSGDHCG